MSDAPREQEAKDLSGRRLSRPVRVGTVEMGGDAPISVQSMTTAHTSDVDATVDQIHRLEECACQIVRVAVEGKDDALALGEIRKQVSIPVVADVHFDPSLAVLAIEQGADKVRVNPGNMKSAKKLDRLAAVIRERGTPVRIGVNSGSVRKRDKGGQIDTSASAVELMVKSLLGSVAFFEKRGCHKLVLSLKSSSVLETIEGYRRIAALTDLPLHVGVTAAGPPDLGVVRNAVGIGTLLAMGIGDTIRVSLTGPPEKEVEAGIEILRSLGLRRGGIRLVSCPTCSRCQTDLVGIVEEVRRRLPRTREELTVAVMGCIVNGPGEAREADVGIVVGKVDGFLFMPGEEARRVPPNELVDRLMEAVEELLDARGSDNRP